MKPNTEYTWISLDGSTHTIRIGYSNITETEVSTLRKLDQVQANDQRRYRRHTISLEVLVPYEGGSQILADPKIDVETEVLDSMELRTLHNQLIEALESLTESQRHLLDQVFEEGLSLREIARREGVSDKAIRKRLQVILQKLKQNFP